MTKIGVDYETERVNFNLPKKLMDRVRDYSREEGIPITYGLQQLLKKGLDTNNSLNGLLEFNKLMEDYKSGNLQLPKES